MAQIQRQNWGKDYKKLPKLDLLKLQKDSYRDFLETGIKESLIEVNGDKGIEDFTGKNWVLTFSDHRFGDPKHPPADARRKNLNYDIPLYANATLLNKKTGEKQTQEVFLGNIPKMTEIGTFIINGIERVVVTQLVRAPGVFFSAGKGKQDDQRVYYHAELRPLRGSWLEINISKRNVVSVKIDRRRKMPMTVLLRAMGYETNEEIMELFSDVNKEDEFNLVETTIKKDTTSNQNEALIELYNKLRPGEPTALATAKQFLKKLFFDSRRYDLGKVGRYKLNRRLKLDVDKKTTVLAKEDVIATIKYLIRLQNGQGKTDDIDHLSNRRLRRIGELVRTNSFRIGLIRLERSIREKMSLTKTDEVLTPAALVNARPLIATVSEFFRRNRLSTILDQTNPLSEIDNLRRLSVMGTGGVTRERASFSMRDINMSQYSRICPVRSPEGPNIGLVTYLTLYAKVNDFGFLEAPYLKLKNVKGKMKVTDELVYLAADDEEDHKITHSVIKIDKKGFISENWIPMRHMNQLIEGPSTDAQYIDVVPRQVIGTSASLIPFIAHDEANRALMGSHMQCQAVPLINPEAPVVGTGMEEAIVTSMHRSVKARFDGVIDYVDALKVVIKLSKADAKKARDLDLVKDYENIHCEGDCDVYSLFKFSRTSQSTSYSQRPIVSKGDKVKKGDVIIDGPASDNGELSLGKNLLIAYTSYNGLGYEDAIVISDRLVKDDVFTSIQINQYSAKVMDTRLGPEELTNDIPNVSEGYLKNLNIDGIVRVGSVVNSGEILVGKIAPKGETELTPEERLLRAIFGDKSRDVRDTSLRLPHGQSGIVIGVTVLDRELGDELHPGTNKEVIVRVAQMRKIRVGDKLAGRHGNKGVISKIVPQADMPYLEDGTPVDIIISPLSVLARMNLGQLLEAHLGWAAKKLGYNVAIPAFEKIDEEGIWSEMEKANLPVDGKVKLYDGLTGKAYDEKTVVGISYILKLSHMVEDKVHARSTGPYSLVTQQPLGGKAQMGGQRLGEMEVWALEAHRAAHVLQEMLTIKSDDVRGRANAFEAMVKGIPIPDPAIPASFQVLVRELNSLGLDVSPQDVEEEIVDRTADADDLAKIQDEVLDPIKEESEDAQEESVVENEEDVEGSDEEIKVPESLLELEKNDDLTDLADEEELINK